MARDASPKNPTAQRALIALAAAGAALGAGAGAASASADTLPGMGAPYQPLSSGTMDPQAGLQALSGSVRYASGSVAGLKPNPLAGTGVDPLDNGVGTQVADFRPVNSQPLTRPVAEAQSLGSVPVVGQVTRLPGGAQG